MVLYALDAQSGKQLYSSGKLLANWVHFNQPTVAQGKVFLVSHDAHVYAFGLPAKARSRIFHGRTGPDPARAGVCINAASLTRRRSYTSRR